jgi:hypothetical protein
VEPVVFRGDPERVAELLSLERVTHALLRGSREEGKLLVTVDAFDDEDAITTYVEQGQPIVWNGARRVSPSLDALTAELAAAFGAHVWPTPWTCPALRPMLERGLEERRAEAVAEPAMTVVTRPGDMLYIPAASSTMPSLLIRNQVWLVTARAS